jgi:catechol 2,3-dioxygenase-like lactoylglutathione lyase family enzyme
LKNISQTLDEIAQSCVPPGAESSAQGVVEIVSPDLDRMLSFYGSLGFRIERRTGPFAVIMGYGVRLFVAENLDAPTAPKWTNLRIIVPDVDLIRGLASELGLPIVHDVGDRFYGLRDFVVADPTGFEIRFAQVL